MCKVWRHEQIPRDWNRGLIIKLPKKGNLKECKNWRGITLLSIVAKILGKIIIDRIRDGVDCRLRKEQAGYRKGRGTWTAGYGLGIKHGLRYKIAVTHDQATNHIDSVSSRTIELPVARPATANIMQKHSFLIKHFHTIIPVICHKDLFLVTKSEPWGLTTIWCGKRLQEFHPEP